MADDELYQEAQPFLEEAARLLGQRLLNAFRKLGDPYLVRARVDSSRIKPLTSIQRKARSKRWTFEQALERCTDLVGYRVVCNNLQDVARAADLLEGSLRDDKIEVHRQDHVKKVKRGGYRAIHLDIELPVALREKTRDVGCEVQIRSLLQDSWARLSRADIYTSERRLSESLLRSMENLSELLHVADKIADDIRREISRPRKGKRPPKDAVLSESAIAFLFKNAFGIDAPDYVIQGILREFSDASIRTDALAEALADKALIKKLRAAYSRHVSWSGPDNEQVFRWVVHAVVNGEQSAILAAESEGKEAWAEIDAIYRREVLSGLPESWQTLAEWIEHPDKDEDIDHDIREWANALGALGSCGVCGTAIVQADTLAQALADHYKLRGRKFDEAVDRLEQAIRNSGVEVGGWDTSSTCAYHADLLSRDD